MTLVRGALLAISFLVRVLFLLCDAGVVSGARFSCWFSFLLDCQRSRNKLRETPLGRLSIAKLTARVACNHANGSIFTQP